jgi:release factor glutamine methyltransferase
MARDPVNLPPHEQRWMREEFSREPERLAIAVQERLDGRPLQYVIAHWPFRSLDLVVDERVLIPRPETEELVHLAFTELGRTDATTPVVVDLGCGSGAIGLSMKSEWIDPRPLRVIGVDNSTDALDVAKINARRSGIEVEFLLSNWFDQLPAGLEGGVDVIVGNPPYVGVDEYVGLESSLHHEPRGALVAEDVDSVPGLADLATIIAQSPRWLRPDGSLVLEHGATHGSVTRELATTAGLVHARTITDMAGHSRFLVAHQPLG